MTVHTIIIVVAESFTFAYSVERLGYAEPAVKEKTDEIATLTEGSQSNNM